MEGQTAPPPTRTAPPPYGRVLAGSTPTGPMDPHAAVALQRAGIDTPSAVAEEAARAAAAIGFQQASAAAAAFSRGHFLDENWSEPRPGRVFYPLQASTTTPALMPTPMAMQMPMPSFAIPYPPPPHTRTPFTEEPPAPVLCPPPEPQRPLGADWREDNGGRGKPRGGRHGSRSGGGFGNSRWGGAIGKRPSNPRPPATYICNRCKVGGHWIHDCPTLKKGRAPPGRVRP